MAITSKPDKKVENDERRLDVKALINKGGTPPQQAKDAIRKEKIIKSVQLRLPEEAVEAIDRAIEEGEALVKPSRHAWLLEAIAEKLQREGIAVRL